MTAGDVAAAPRVSGEPGTVNEELAIGDKSFAAGRLDQAIDAYRKAVGMAPNSARAHYKLGVALGRTGKYKEAVEQLESAVKMNPSDVRIERTLAGVYEVLNMTEQAQAAYQRVIGMSTNPGIVADANKRFILVTAKAYTEKGNPAAALEILNYLRRQQGEDPEVLYYIGIVQMLSNRPAAAEAAFKDVLKIMPNNKSAYESLIKVYEQENKIDDVIATLEKLLTLLNPRSGEYRSEAERLALFKGRRALEKGNLPRAEAAFQSILSGNPRDPSANYGIGLVYQQEKRYDDAAKYFNRVLKVVPGHLDARLHLAMVYLQLNRLREGVDELRALMANAGNSPQGRQAKDILERLEASLQRQRGSQENIEDRIKELQGMLAKDPNQVQARLQLGALYLRKGDLKDARVQYEAVTKLEPSNETAHGALGDIFDNLGLYDQSVEQYAITISLEQNPLRADEIADLLMEALGKKYFNANNMDEAKDVFGLILDRRPDDPSARLFSGLIQMRNGDYEQAIESFRNIIIKSPNNLSARINLGLAYERLNREDDAIHEYRYILERNPKSSIGEAAARQLKQAQKRIKGFSTNMNYRVVYDSNSNLSHQAAQNYRTDVFLNFSYLYKADNGIRYNLAWEPQYSVYHVGQFDFLTNNLSVSLAKVMARQTLSGGYTYRIQNGLLSGIRVSTSSTVFLESDESFRMPSIVKWDSAQPVPTSTRLDFFYTDLTTTANRFFSAKTITLALTFDQQVDARQVLGIGYYYTRNRNKDQVGSDNAYDSHHLSFDYQRRLWPRVSGNIAYDVLYYTYINPDSFSNFTKRRVNLTNMITAGFTYSFRPNMSFYLDFLYQTNHSNLPVGFVFSAQQRAEGQQNNAPGTIIGVQSTALGNFSREVVTFGMAWNF